jgi:amidase
MAKYIYIFALLFIFSCKNEVKEISKTSEETELPTALDTDFREFKVLDSKYLTNTEIWSQLDSQLSDFKEADYNRLKPLVIEQDIPTLQKHIADGRFNYEQLTKFYLYRIRKFDRENDLSLNSVIAVNPNVIELAKKADQIVFVVAPHAIFGMPILLKDNVNAEGMATTAGAAALQNNNAADAFIVRQLKSKGALILGKANLSEWAYFFCGDCPSGYSAIGGQTLNPYGRRIFDTGGSSSGSGVSVSANFCAAAIGSETSGSILSPASSNSTVGLKPTIGLVSRGGIVPISSTLDTAGPITKNVTDNAILLDAMFGEDKADSKAIGAIWESGFYTEKLKEASLKGKRFGAPKRLLSDTLYLNALEVMKSQGAIIVEIEELSLGLPNFISLLNLEMKKDLPVYMKTYADKSVTLRTIENFMTYNRKDSLKIMPYGQNLFKGIIEDTGDAEFLERIQDTIKRNGRAYFDQPMQANQLDGVLSINNFHAGFAAAAEYPAITVPMGYTKEGRPKGLTFISTRLREKQLLEWAYVYEQASKMRVAPKNYN